MNQFKNESLKVLFYLKKKKKVIISTEKKVFKIVLNE